MSWLTLVLEIIRFLFDYLKKKELVTETETLIHNRLLTKTLDRINEGRTVRDEVAEKVRTELANNEQPNDDLLLSPEMRDKANSKQ